VAWRAVAGPLPLAFRRGVAAREGGTRVTISYEARTRGALRLAATLLQPLDKRQLAGDLPKLKDLLEADAR
jgi:hypothetical protein